MDIARQSIVRALAVFLCICAVTYQVSSTEEFQIQNVCAESAGDGFGEIVSPRPGYIVSIALAHVPCSDSKPEECQVSCNSKPTTFSYWSCNDVNRDKLNVYITDKNNNELFPGPRKQIFNRYGFYKYGSDFSASSPTLIFNDTGCPRVKVQAGDQLRMWYGEDLLNIGEQDNMGRVCADVKITYKDVSDVENPSGLTGGYTSRVCYTPANNGFGMYCNPTRGFIKEIDLARSCASIPCNGDGDENFGCYDQTVVDDLQGISITAVDGLTTHWPNEFSERVTRVSNGINGVESTPRTIEFVEECPRVKMAVGMEWQLHDTALNHAGFHNYVCFNIYSKDFADHCGSSNSTSFR